MAQMYNGFVRRIDFEPKKEFLDDHVYAHVFLQEPDGEENVDVYTDDPRFEAAFLAAFSPRGEPLVIEVHYEELDPEGAVIRVVTRVALERKVENP